MEHILACESAIGIHAAAAIAGGADMVIASFSEYRRILGYDMTQAFRYSDSMNQIILEIAEHVIPVCKNIPVFAGVNIYNDMEDVKSVLRALKKAGYKGVMNAPEARLYKKKDGIEAEYKMLIQAKQEGFQTAGVVVDEEDLYKMKEADPDLYMFFLPKKSEEKGEERLCRLVQMVKEGGKKCLLYPTEGAEQEMTKRLQKQLYEFAHVKKDNGKGGGME